MENKNISPALIISISTFIIIISTFEIYQKTRILYYWDAWIYVNGLIDFINGKISTWEWFHRKYNEHRVGLTNLTLYIDMIFFGGKNILLTIISTTSLFLTGFILIFISTTGYERTTRFGYSLLGGASMIATSALANTSGPTQVQFAYAQIIPILFFISYYYSSSSLKNVVVLFLSVMCAETMASGIFAPVSALIASLFYFGSIRSIIFLSISSAITVLYYNISTQYDHYTHSVFVYNIHKFLFFITAIGNPYQTFIELGYSISIFVGFLILLISSIIIIFHRRRYNPSKADMVIISTIMYSGLTLLAMSVSRGEFELESALTSRYATPAILYSLSVLALLFRISSLEGNQRTFRVACVAMFGCLVIFSQQNDRAISEIDSFNLRIDAATSSLRKGLFEPELISGVAPSVSAAAEIVNYIRINKRNVFSGMKDFDQFDWQAYVDNYKDLSSIKNKDEAWHHYINNGFSEGRSDNRILSLYKNE